MKERKECNDARTAAIWDIKESYLLMIDKVIAFCNGILYYGTPCITFEFEEKFLEFYQARRTKYRMKNYEKRDFYFVP